MSQIPEYNPEDWSDLPVEPAGYAQQGNAQQYDPMQNEFAQNEYGQNEYGQNDYGQNEYGQSIPMQNNPMQGNYPQNDPLQGSPVQGTPVQGNYPQNNQGNYAQNEYGQAYYAQPAAAPFPAAEPENVPVLSEFDHLFRDSPLDSRRSVPQNTPTVRVSGEVVVPGQAAPQQYQGGNPPQGQWPANQQQPPLPQQYVQQEPDQVYDQYQPDPQQYPQTAYMQQTQTAYQPGYGPGQYQQGQDGGEQEWLGGEGGGKKRTPALIGGGVALVVAVGLVLAFTSNSSGAGPKKSPTQAATTAVALTAPQQAAQLMSIVSQSAQLRSSAIAAVDDLSSATCGQLTQDESSLQATSKARAGQAKAVAALDVSKLPGGTQLVSDLSQAWQASSTSDAAYAKIAGDMAAQNVTDCKSTYGTDANYHAAVQADGDATRAKNAAAALWNSDLTAAPISEATISASSL